MTPRFAFASALFCLTACSSSHDAPDAPAGGDTLAADAPVTADAACTTIATTRCTKLQSCSPADLEKRFGDLATCETRETLACTEALAAPMTGNTPSATLACSDAIGAESCPDFFSKVPPTACTTQIGPGSGACGFSAECATGFCGVATDALCGTCAPQPAIGDACATIGCGQDLVCVAATSLCQSPVVANGACSRDLPCADGLTCVGANAQTSTTGLCTPEVTTANGACDPKHKTGADCSADAGLACDTTTTTCVAQPLVAAGMVCGPINGITTKCSGAATCVIPGNQTTGTCVAPAADGATCDTVAGPTCFTPARCVSTTAGGTAGTCQLPGSPTCQ